MRALAEFRAERACSVPDHERSVRKFGSRPRASLEGACGTFWLGPRARFHCRHRRSCGFRPPSQPARHAPHRRVAGAAGGGGALPPTANDGRGPIRRDQGPAVDHGRDDGAAAGRAGARPQQASRRRGAAPRHDARCDGPPRR